MGTGSNWTTVKRFRHWHKFLVSGGVGVALLVVANFVSSSAYLQWAAAGVFLFAAWFFILAALEAVEKLQQQ